MGFRRPLTPAELDSEYWYRLGNLAIGWLEPTKFKNFWCPHFVVAPWARGHTFKLIQFAFEELKGEGYLASGCVPGAFFALPPDRKGLARIFTRLGFVYDAEKQLYYAPFGEEHAWERMQGQF